MNRTGILKWLFIAVLLVASIVINGRSDQAKDSLYQVSILSGLAKGDYDGKVEIREVKKHGDFGIGTFDKLDGEEIELDGIFYQVRSDGTVKIKPLTVKTPFAMTVFFKNDVKMDIDRCDSIISLIKIIDAGLPDMNMPYAVKIEGRFRYIKTRSVPAQEKPYPPLIEVIKKQSVFEFRDIEGTLVGFRMPDYAGGINTPGYHMHFISKDKTRGGHVLEVSVDKATVFMDKLEGIDLRLQ